MLTLVVGKLRLEPKFMKVRPILFFNIPRPGLYSTKTLGQNSKNRIKTHKRYSEFRSTFQIPAPVLFPQLLPGPTTNGYKVDFEHIYS